MYGKFSKELSFIRKQVVDIEEYPILGVGGIGRYSGLVTALNDNFVEIEDEKGNASQIKFWMPHHDANDFYLIGRILSANGDETYYENHVLLALNDARAKKQPFVELMKSNYTINKPDVKLPFLKN